MYRLSCSCLGFYPADDKAFWYEGDDIHFRVLFKTEDHADVFENRLQDALITTNAAVEGQGVNSSVISSDEPLQKKIMSHDYVCTDTDSPQDTMSKISSHYSTYELSSDVFRYQRIEDLKFFGTHGKAESCHIMSKAHCSAYESYQKFNGDESNRLALSRDAHGWYDALSTDIPLINITFVEASEKPVHDNRFTVIVAVEAFDLEAARMMFYRLKDGSKHTDNQLIMTTSVSVVNVNVFKTCLLWKSKQIQKLWDDYKMMTPAIP